MRRKMTLAERTIWPLLKAQGFKAQVVVYGYIADFAHPKCRLIVEADGERHSVPTAKAYDQARDWHLFCKGYKVLRFSNQAILNYPANIAEQVIQQMPSRYSPIPKSRVKSSSAKQVLIPPSVQTTTDGLATVSRENTASGSVA